MLGFRWEWESLLPHSFQVASEANNPSQNSLFWEGMSLILFIGVLCSVFVPYTRSLCFQAVFTTEKIVRIASLENAMVLSNEAAGTYHIQSNPDQKVSRGVPKESHVLLERKPTEQADQIVKNICRATSFRFSHDEPLQATAMERGRQPLLHSQPAH